MLKKFTLSLIRLAKKAAAGVAAWLASLFVILIIGTIFQLSDHSPTISTLYSLSVVFVPIVIGLFFFFAVCKSQSLPSQDIVICTVSELNTFLDTHDLVDTISTKVVGVTFNNGDGSSRQTILSHCNVGDQVYFQFFIYQGKPAYSVTTNHGQIGNLSADLAQTIDLRYDGCTLCGTITKISGGIDGLYYGCHLQISVFREKHASAPPGTERKTSPQILHEAPAASSTHNIVYPNQQKRKEPKTPDVDSSFIAEAQWYTAHSGTNPDADE